VAMLKTKKWLRWIPGLLLLVVTGCFLRTEAFAAWIGFSVGLVVYAFCYRPMRKMVLGSLILFVTAAALLSIYTGQMEAHLSLSYAGTSERIAWLKSSFMMIRDKPILGHGLNTYMATYMDYWVGGSRTPVYAHNCYLQMAAETGFIGLVLFLGVLRGIFVRLFIGFKWQDEKGALVLLAFMVCMTSFVVQAAFDTNFYALRQAFLFWSVAGMAVGFAYRKVPAHMGLKGR